MAEEQQQDGQKTLVAFIVGLLIGGMLVWAFSGPSASAPTEEPDTEVEEMTEEGDSNSNTTDAESNSDGETTDNTNDSVEAVDTPELQVGDGEVVVPDQAAGMSVTLESAVYPVSEGWIGVRDFNNEQLGMILGVVRFSETDGLIPSEIVLQRATTPGDEYAIVIYTEDGDRDFSLAGDVQIDTVFDTFTAE